MTARRAGAAMLAAAALLALAAPLVAPHGAGEQFSDFPYAPPMPLRIIDADGSLRAPFVYPLSLVNRLERIYEEDRARPVPVRWLRAGRLVSIDETRGPLLLLGSDQLGRDIFARLVLGARPSLAVAVTAALGALLLGSFAGALAGYVGGLVDEVVMRTAEFVLVLPAIYVVLALRSVVPLDLDPRRVFILMAAILALVSWPFAARGVRAILAAERRREYAEAARSLGAGHGRLLVRHLLPACHGFLRVQALLLLPAFILAEATLSYVGLGFPEPVASWGTMLRDAANVRAIAEFPWLLSPAAAIVLVVLALHLAGGVQERPSALIGEPVHDR
jgi:peptide/nickel transport system permease protein